MVVIKNKKRRDIIIYLGIIAIVFITISVQLPFILKSQTTVGYVTEVLAMASYSYPRVKFEFNDKEYLILGAQNEKLEMGEMVEIRFIPEKPNEAKINTFTSIWLKSLLEGIIACLIWTIFILSISNSMLVRVFYRRKFGKNSNSIFNEKLKEKFQLKE